MTIHTGWIAFQTLALKEIKRVFRLWSQSLLPPIITIALYFIIFGKIIGSQLRLIDGFSYMQYITPGLIMMPIITAAYTNTSGSFFVHKFQKNIEEMLVSPMPNCAILFGFVIGGIFRALLVGVCITIISLFFTQLHIHSVFITVSVALLSAILFSLAGILNAIFANKFDDITFIPVFIITPLTYLGGVFFPAKLLPKFWFHLSLFNPILHIVNAFRYGFLGISDIAVSFALLILIGCIIILFFLCLFLLNKGIGIRT